MHQTHRDAVVQLPPGVSSIGSSSRCAVHGMYLPNRVLSFQGHPEFDEEAMRLILGGRHALGFFDDAEYEEGMSRVGLPHCGEMLAVKICEFFLAAGRA